MILQELFKDDKHGGSVSKAESDLYVVSKQIGDREITFQARKHGKDVWELFFIEYVDGHTSFEKTGSGDEVKVFNFVIAATKEFLEKYKPKRFSFSAEKQDENRSSLYRRLVKRFKPDGYIAREFETGLGNAPKHTDFDFVRIDEVLDKAVDYKVEKNKETHFEASFNLNDRKIIFTAVGEYEDYDDDGDDDDSFNDNIAWHVSFSQIDDDGDERHDVTGGGKEFEVFATIKKIMHQFVKMYDPQTIKFKSDADNRSNLYQRILKRSLPVGWDVWRDDDKFSDTKFTLYRESSMPKPTDFVRINELLDKAVDYEVTEREPDYFKAMFNLNDRKLFFIAENGFDTAPGGDRKNEDDRIERWDVSFGQVDKDGGGRWDLTGGGKEFEVFATIKKIMQQFIKEYQPNLIKFSADKRAGEEDDNRSSRASLYQKMVQRSMPSGWTLERDDSSKHYAKFIMRKK